MNGKFEEYPKSSFDEKILERIEKLQKIESAAKLHKDFYKKHIKKCGVQSLLEAVERILKGLGPVNPYVDSKEDPPNVRKSGELVEQYDDAVNFSRKL